jgi:hypothetical protein
MSCSGSSSIDYKILKFNLLAFSYYFVSGIFCERKIGYIRRFQARTESSG